MIHHCCDPRRRELVLANPPLNGIDFLEVLDTEHPLAVPPQPTPRQRTLLLRFLRTAPDLALSNIELTGGERITGIGLEWVTRADAPDAGLIGPSEPSLPGYLSALPDPDQVLALRTDSSGDYATYTLRLVAGPGALTPPAGIDRLLSEISFSFKVECPTDFDCAPRHDCPDETGVRPAISYLAKDYRSFRRLMLSRMAEIMPDWRERNPADLGITLVEMLAYTADRLSYAQDAVATEAYLATARRRSSVRRHARLVDYRMHDGGNARVWVQLSVNTDGVAVRRKAEGIEPDRFLTRLIGRDPVIAPGKPAEDALLLEPLVFEPLHDKTLHVAQNAMDFYAWGDEECCLPKGATRATLSGHFPDLSPGDVLIFEERIGPRTGEASDADPNRRHAVQLSAIETGLFDELPLEPGAGPAPITEIRWAEEDALPFPVCLSSRLDDAVGGGLATRVSHALGNVVLADHGLSIVGEDLGTVPEPRLHVVPAGADTPCHRPEPQAVPPRYRPILAESPVTQASPWTANALPTSAFAAMDQRLDNRRPEVSLTGATASVTRRWEARRDLLQSLAGDTEFVVETERNGSARLRFGDDRNGLRPASGTAFTADYRVGNGAIGNVGHDAVRHVVTGQGGIVAVRNPIPASGGAEPESMQAVREAAPYAYRVQERAVTPKDYADAARRHPDVQRAAATFRWNGHGHTVFVTVDRFGGRPVTAAFEDDLRGFLERFRMAGYDLEIDAPRFVALELGLFVCAGANHFRSQVRRAVLEALSARVLPNGAKGFFHPDNFSFADPVWLSAIYAVAMTVEGVTSVEARLFRRRGRPDPAALADGVIEMGRLEIAQLENDPSFPERGALEVEMGGGK